MAKVAQIHKWHQEGKYWSFPNPNGTLAKILKVFKGEAVFIDPALQSKEAFSPEELSDLPLPCPGWAKEEVFLIWCARSGISISDGYKMWDRKFYGSYTIHGLPSGSLFLLGW